MKPSQDSLAAVLLASRLASDGVQPFKASEFWRLVEHVGKPGALLGEPVEGLVRDHGIARTDAERIVSLFERATAVAFELDELEQSGVATLTPFDDRYPARFVERLGAKAPGVLHAIGNLDLFGQAGLGVVGSRDVSEQGGEVARAAAQVAGRLHVPLVSGGARGVDQLAMNAASEIGGSVIGFLADSLMRTASRPDVRRAVYDGSTLMCTPYGPNAPFNAGTAMGRNKLIYAQSMVTFVVASDHESGGTWSGAIEALKTRSGLVAVWRGEGEGAGNKAIEQRGAESIATVDDLVPFLDGSVRGSYPVVLRQASLFD